MTKATLEIRIWTNPEAAPLPDDLGEAFAPHAEHVAEMLATGFTSGDVCDDRFRGWWEIKTS